MQGGRLKNVEVDSFMSQIEAFDEVVIEPRSCCEFHKLLAEARQFFGESFSPQIGTPTSGGPFHKRSDDEFNVMLDQLEF